MKLRYTFIGWNPKTLQQCQRFLISGRVQGVFFRGSTRDKALSLGLTGYANNLPDGRVEVLACGDSDKINILYKWFFQGPPIAEVTDVYREISEPIKLVGFQTG